MTAIPLNRREFLFLAGAFVVPLLPGVAGRLGLGRQTDVEALAGRFVGMLGRPESAAVIGREYLRHNTHEASLSVVVPALAQAITQTTMARSAPGASSTDDGSNGVRVCLATSGADLGLSATGAVRRDFATDEIVVVGGWVLSRTEARLCAVSALT
jgi:hypothetical protein